MSLFFHRFWEQGFVCCYYYAFLTVIRFLLEYFIERNKGFSTNVQVRAQEVHMYSKYNITKAKARKRPWQVKRGYIANIKGDNPWSYTMIGWNSRCKQHINSQGKKQGGVRWEVFTQDSAPWQITGAAVWHPNWGTIPKSTRVLGDSRSGRTVGCTKWNA